jgi:hypothetical protein
MELLDFAYHRHHHRIKSNQQKWLNHSWHKKKKNQITKEKKRTRKRIKHKQKK